MANVMSLLKLSNKPKRNGFDRSRKNAFTAKAGELLPVMCEHVMPSDKYRINVSSFTRTQPLETSAFTRLTEYYDFYFVPYRLLWRYSLQFFSHTNENQFAEELSLSPSKFPTRMPHCDMDTLCEVINDSTVNNALGYSFKETAKKLINYLDYGMFHTDFIDSQNYDVNLMPFAAYQKIYFDHFRNSQWETNNPLCYNFDYISDDSDVDISAVLLSGQSNNLFSLRYCNYPVDYFQGLLPSPQFGETATLTSNAGSVDLSGLKLNKLEFLPGVTPQNTGGDISQGNRAAIYSEITNSGSGSLFFGSSFDSNHLIYKMKANNIVAQFAGLGSVAASSFNILDLRKAEAKQRWSEITQPNAKDYPSQMNAHFDSNTPDVLGNISTWIGGFSSNINIGDVLNTNLDESTDTSDSMKRAWIKGKGTFVNNGNVEFDVKEHGIIMCIYHVLPRLDYDSNGVDPFNVKTSYEDFAIPEFDSIGMQAVPFLFLSNNVTWDNVGAVAKNIGYAPRYAEYKTAIDKVHGAFLSTLKSWYSPVSDEYVRTILANGPSNWYLFQKCNPSVLNTIFGVNADSTVDTDQFLVNSYFDVKAIRPLDRNGLPY